LLVIAPILTGLGVGLALAGGRFGVDLPATWASKVNARAVNVSLTGRNLKTWTKVPNIDPEFSYQTGNNQGIESMVLPNAKGWGFNVRITQ